MLKVGITGGIGSGKSTVCQVFAALGIPVFNADDAAKYLLENDAQLIANMKALFGEHVYSNKKLDRALVSSFVFADKEKLSRLNALVHPATIRYAKEWMQAQTTTYTIKEAAIFFETGSNKDMDVMIGVSAPQELRIARVMQRANTTHEDILRRMAQQMDEAEKMALCDYVITNDDSAAILPQVLQLHGKLLSLANRKN